MRQSVPGATGGAGFEHIRVGHGVQGHGCAIAPAPNAHAAAIELRVLREELVEGGELVFQFDRAKLMTDGGHEFAIARGCAAIVHGENGESSLGQNLMKEPGRSGPVFNPAISDKLRGGAAVDIHDQRESCR